MKTRVLMALLVLIMLLALLAPFTAEAAAGPIDFAALDAAIAAQMAKHGLPGAALAVVEGGEILYLKGYGSAGRRAMTPQTQMFIGSQSKSFTALAVAQLAEQGELDLNAPVRTYIPWFKVADEAASGQITINHLLHHTSGLSESGYTAFLPADATTEEAVRSLAGARLTAPVGTKHQYFNIGYDVLTYIIETVSGQSYADYLRTHVFRPLDMSRSTADPATASDLAQGYSRLFGFPIPVRQTVRQYEIGAGYIVSTAEDMARYAMAMMHDGGGLVTPETAGRIFTPGLGDYGMGWYVNRGRTKIWHGGANEAFRTEVNLYPKDGRVFVLLVNEGHLADHYIASKQLTDTVEAIVLGGTPPSVGLGTSVRTIGWALGALVLGLILLHTFNFRRLRSWPERARAMSPAKKTLDVAISFIIPTVILVIIFSQMRAFFGYRFNLGTNLVMMRYALPDVFVLMIVGTIPDYMQGFVKLRWAVRGKVRPPLMALAVVALLTVSCASPQVRPLPAARHAETSWVVQASLPLDALAFINTLTADPLVGGHYAAARERFAFDTHPKAAQAAQRLAEYRSEDLGSNLSGFLYPWFMAGKPRTLDDLIRLADKSEILRQALRDYDASGVEMNVYYHDDGWKMLQRALPDVKALLVFLKESGFETYWQEEVSPGLQADLDRVRAEVQGYNIVPEIEAAVGFGLPSDEVVVSLVYFEWPYGHHILGTHFATTPEDKGVLRSTVHELLHHPFNNTDPAFWQAANTLKSDPTIWGAFDRRDPKYGYNAWPYYVAEDSVRALEQSIEAKLGLGERWTWREDGGMHRLAAVLYRTMQEEGSRRGGESYQAFFIRVVRAGKLQANAGP